MRYLPGFGVAFFLPIMKERSKVRITCSENGAVAVKLGPTFFVGFFFGVLLNAMRTEDEGHVGEFLVVRPSQQIICQG